MNLLFSAVLERLRGTLELDQSISEPELGSLFDWRGDKPLQRAKRRMAEAYGAAWAFPSTNGTTTANLLAILTLCPPGGRILLNRDAHVSAFAAAILGDLTPVYVVPEYDSEMGCFRGPVSSTVEAALERHRPDCVFLTSPSYSGLVGEIRGCIDAAHRRGIPVAVDAAHAPHFHFCSSLPLAAEDAGADLVTQSTHKVANALSQASLVLFREERYVEQFYDRVNHLGLVSTSFSFPLIASLELGVEHLRSSGEILWNRTIELAERFRAAVREIAGLRCIGSECVGRPGVTAMDLTRVTLDVSRTGMTGLAFEERLYDMGIRAEMATLHNVLFLFTPATSEVDAARLLDAVQRLAEVAPGRMAGVPLPPPLPEAAYSPRQAYFAEKRRVPLSNAVGEVAGETIAVFPPGAPVVAAGEVITREVLEYLSAMHRCGGVLKGASDPSFNTIPVIRRQP